MNSVQIIARTEDTVTLRSSDYEALMSAAEDAADIALLVAAEAEETAVGKKEARRDHLPDALVGRLLAGEHPIAIWREHRGWSVPDLAKRASVARAYLAEVEGGRKPGSIRFYRAVAAALGVTVDDILQG